MSLRYVFTTHRNRPGVRLSKPGYWGNIPFETEDEALTAVRLDANGRPFTIDREHVNKALSEFGT